jgi:hypothetical protein
MVALEPASQGIPGGAASLDNSDALLKVALNDGETKVGTAFVNEPLRIEQSGELAGEGSWASTPDERLTMPACALDEIIGQQLQVMSQQLELLSSEIESGEWS